EEHHAAFAAGRLIRPLHQQIPMGRVARLLQLVERALVRHDAQIAFRSRGGHPQLRIGYEPSIIPHTNASFCCENRGSPCISLGGRLDLVSAGRSGIRKNSRALAGILTNLRYGRLRSKRCSSATVRAWAGSAARLTFSRRSL